MAKFNQLAALETSQPDPRASVPLASDQERWPKWKVCPRCGCFRKQEGQLAAAAERWTIK